MVIPFAAVTFNIPTVVLAVRTELPELAPVTLPTMLNVLYADPSAAIPVN
jgi:hypothetical protein